VLVDHGYNPTPIWTLIARPLTGLFPVETRSLWILARLDGGAGALLTLSSLLRIFPALFVFGYALRQLRLWLRDRTLEAGFRRFLMSSLVTALALGTLAVAAAGRGPGVYLEFSRRLAVQVDFVPNNGFGLRHLLAYTSEKPKPEVVDGVRTLRMGSIQKLRNERLAEHRILCTGE
jgi:hypothetical protein